jgi:uncharacterized delta-60 repeat protein
MHQVSFALILIASLLVSASASAVDGTLDPTFGTNGITVTDLGSTSDTGLNIVLQPDGKIIMAGSGSSPIIARYNLDGTLDSTFGIGGELIAVIRGPVALQTDGKLIIGGGINGGVGLARYTSNGVLDTTFGTNGVASVWENNNSNFQVSFGDLAIQPDGKIVVVGSEEAVGGNHVYCMIVRLKGNGVPDGDFRTFFDESNFPESERNYCKAVALQSDGKIILSGQAEPNFAGMAIILGRLVKGPDLRLDAAFGTNGHGTVVTPIASFVHGRGALAIQANGKIVIAGTMTSRYNPLNEDLVLARYNSNGTLDTTLGGNGIIVTDLGQNEEGTDLAIQKDGKIIVVGKSYGGTSSDILLMRYNSDGSLDTSFGDAGKVISDFGGSSHSALGMALQPDGKILAVGAKDGDAVLARYTGTLPPTTTTTFKSKAAQDGWILESAESSDVGGSLNRKATTFNVGDDVKDKQYRSIISFNTAALPDNAFITSVQVNIKRQGLVGTDPFTTHGNLVLEIRNGLFNNDLALSLSDFIAPPSSATPETFTNLGNGWYRANLRSSNLAFINKMGPTQFRLRFELDDNDDLNADYLKFFTGEAPSARQPQLVVTYVLP